MKLILNRTATVAGAVALMASLLAAPVAMAADLRIGVEGAPTAMDPHWHNFGPNKSLHGHIFETMIRRDADMRLEPSLALSWTAVDPLTWEFRLRPGVRFHDGTPLTAEDVAYTINRAATMQSGAATYALYLRQIKASEVVDPLTVRFKTEQPFPLMPAYLSTIFITSKANGEKFTPDDMNQGRGVIGTGPYRFVSWVRGNSAELVINPDYWGPKPEWEKVSVRSIPTPVTRLASLLAGDVDIIDAVPSQDIARLRGNPNVALFTKPSTTILTMFPDHRPRPSPKVLDTAGRPLTVNPIADVRVRRALSMAINRQLLADRVLDGLGTPTGQFLLPSAFAHLPDVGVPEFDPTAARRLLAEAGYPDGFQLTINCQNNRFINDEQICQALGQAFTRIGIRTQVEALPHTVMIAAAGRGELSLFMHGFTIETAEPSSYLQASLATQNPARGRGAVNRGGYTNPKLDAALDAAVAEIDDAKREAALREATRVALDEVALIPLYHQLNAWATRAGFAYTPRTDESTLAAFVRGSK
jgi:peptide/nickel transport system substrate-binding protein